MKSSRSRLDFMIPTYLRLPQAFEGVDKFLLVSTFLFNQASFHNPLKSIPHFPSTCIDVFFAQSLQSFFILTPGAKGLQNRLLGSAFDTVGVFPGKPSLPKLILITIKVEPSTKRQYFRAPSLRCSNI